MNTISCEIQTERKIQVNIMSYKLFWKMHIDEETYPEVF